MEIGKAQLEQMQINHRENMEDIVQNICDLDDTRRKILDNFHTSNIWPYAQDVLSVRFYSVEEALNKLYEDLDNGELGADYSPIASVSTSDGETFVYTDHVTGKQEVTRKGA